MSIETAWPEQAAALDDVDGLAALWLDGAREVGVGEGGEV